MSVAVETPRIDSITSRIRGVRSRLFIAGGIEFLGKTLVYLVVAAIVSFIVDREIEPQLHLRLPILAFILGVAVVGIISELGRWFRSSALSDDDIANRIEANNPWLSESLISSLQLYRELESGNSFQSRPLIVSTIQSFLEKQKQHSFRTVREARLTRRLPMFLVGAAAIGAIVASFQYEKTRVYALAWRDRVLFLDSETIYPKPVVIKIEIPDENKGSSPYELFVVRGEDLTITANIVRGGTDSMRILTRFLSSGTLEDRRMAQISDSSYSKTYQNVTEPFELVVDAGYSVRTKRYSVTLVERARIEQARFWLQYPEYTGLEPTPADKAITRTSLEVPVGTVIRYEVRSTRAVKSANMTLFTDAKNAKALPGPKPKLEGSGDLQNRIIAGSLIVDKSMRFQFKLVSDDGVSGDKNSVLYSVKAIQDKPPVVTFKKPGRSKSVSKTASMPIELHARDKYGVELTEFHFKISRAGVVVKRGKEVLKNGTGTDKKTVYAWNYQIVDLDLQEGDQVEYWAVAFDRNADVKKRSGRSLAYTITIVSKDDLSRLLSDRLLRIKDDLSAAQKAQENAKRNMELLNQKLAGKTEMSKDNKRSLSRVENQQRNVTTRMKKIASDIQKLKEEREVNRITSDQAEEQLQQVLEEGAKDVAAVQSPKVERQIREALSQKQKLDRNKLSKIENGQRRIEQGIQSLVDRLDKWGDISDVLRELQDIIEKEKQVFEGTGANMRKSKK